MRALRALGPHVRALILGGAHAVQEWAGHVDAALGGSPMSRDAEPGRSEDDGALRSSPTVRSYSVAAAEEATWTPRRRP
jgi:hypothetical protein